MQVVLARQRKDAHMSTILSPDHAFNKTEDRLGVEVYAIKKESKQHHGR